MPRTGNLQTLQQHAPLLTAAVLLCLFAVYLAWQTNAWLRLAGEPVAADAATVQPQTTPPDLDRMASLFGAPPAPVAAGANGPTPETDLGLTLHGSLVNEDPARSTAIIERQGTPPQLFTSGTEIVPGVELTGVFPDHVEISRDGRTEILRFPDTGSASFVSTDVHDFPDPNTGLPPGSEPVMTDTEADLMEQQMDALRQQMEAAMDPNGNPPPDDQPMEEN